jgi:hypothetical protein
MIDIVEPRSLMLPPDHVCQCRECAPWDTFGPHGPILTGPRPEWCVTVSDQRRSSFIYTILIDGLDVTRRCWKAVSPPGRDGFVCVYWEWPDMPGRHHVCQTCRQGCCEYVEVGRVTIEGRPR